MKIAFLLTQLEVGGAQTRVFETAAELRRRGHHVDVVFLYEKRCCFEGEPKVVLHEGRRPGPRQLPALLFKLRGFLARGGYDALVTNTAPANVLGCTVGLLAGMKKRVAVQTQPPQRLSKALRAADQLAGSLGIYTTNVANSDWTRGCFADYGAAYRKRMVTIKNGISPPLSTLPKEAARASFGIKAGEFIIANVGRLSEQKDHETLIKAMSKVHGRLLIAGEGELRAALEQQVRDAGILDRVTFLGEIPRHQIGELFRAADAFAFSSRWETFGLALVEAAASGLPLAVTNLDVFHEVLGRESRSALFVEARNPDGFADALNRLRDDPDLRDEMSRLSLEVAANHSLQLHVFRLEGELMQPASGPRYLQPAVEDVLRAT